jgi:restriction endonuclease S subunit
MSGYTISAALNKDRVFILHRSELEKRLDPFYYIPSLVAFENKVLAKIPQRLRDFVVSIASGATPKTTESELYYTNKENGIPFLRVQNLSPTGVLEFDDCKYINHETHNGFLKRSQVFENDLLVKITGVGRMAVASVAPEGFEGNINQHICVIKTVSKEASEIIAAFLNTDIGEKLAGRRSTGGTRPALDYPALLSIPIIKSKRVLAITKNVVDQKTKNEAEAEKLLSSIDDYLMKELGIVLPEVQENSLKSRMFISSLGKLSGNRLDPFYYGISFYNLIDKIENGKYKPCKIGIVCNNIDTGRTPAKAAYVENEAENILRIVKAGSYTGDFIDIEKSDFVKSDFDGNIVNKGDIFILGAAHQAEYVGKKVYYLNEEPKERTFFVGELVRITANPTLCESSFLFSLLKTKLYLTLLNREKRGQTSHLYPNDVKNILIPLPPIEKQKEIAEHITAIRKQAQALKDKTKEALKLASKEIEEILLN